MSARLTHQTSVPLNERSTEEPSLMAAKVRSLSLTEKDDILSDFAERRRRERNLELTSSSNTSPALLDRENVEGVLSSPVNVFPRASLPSTEQSPNDFSRSPNSSSGSGAVPNSAAETLQQMKQETAFYLANRFEQLQDTLKTVGKEGGELIVQALITSDVQCPNNNQAVGNGEFSAGVLEELIK